MALCKWLLCFCQLQFYSDMTFLIIVSVQNTCIKNIINKSQHRSHQSTWIQTIWEVGSFSCIEFDNTFKNLSFVCLAQVCFWVQPEWAHCCLLWPKEGKHTWMKGACLAKPHKDEIYAQLKVFSNSHFNKINSLKEEVWLMGLANVSCG